MHPLLLAAAPVATSTTSSAAPSPSVFLPGLALLALAGVAFAVSRRNRPASGRRLLEVVETAAIGPRRSLVVARVGDEALVLGVSEAGIALLATRPATDLAPGRAGAAPEQEPGERQPFEDALQRARAGGVADVSAPSPAARLKALVPGWFGLRGAASSARATGAGLAGSAPQPLAARPWESPEVEELRRKLQGVGSVR